MNSHELERELAGLRPLEISVALTQGVAARLETTFPTEGELIAGRVRLFCRRSGLLAAAAALLVAAMFAAWEPESNPASRSASMVEPPTALTYQRAFARSAESLDALLDSHAANLSLGAPAPRAGDPHGALFPLLN